MPERQFQPGDLVHYQSRLFDNVNFDAVFHSYHSQNPLAAFVIRGSSRQARCSAHQRKHPRALRSTALNGLTLIETVGTPN